MAAEERDRAEMEAKLGALRQMEATLRSQGAALDPATLQQTLAPILKQIAELERQRAHIDTAGGAAVRDVITGRDFIGRDLWEVVLGDKHEYNGVPPDQLPPDILEEAYLCHLAGICDRLQISAVDPKYVSATGESRIRLAAVYSGQALRRVRRLGRGRHLVVDMTTNLRIHRIRLESVKGLGHAGGYPPAAIPGYAPA